MESTLRHLKHQLCAHTASPRPSPPVLSASGLTTTCRILMHADTPFPCAQSFALWTWSSGSKAAQGWGLRLRCSGVTWGEENIMQFPLPQGESVGSGREGFSSCAQAARGPRLASRVPQRRRGLSLARGEERRKTPNQSGRAVERAKTSQRGLSSSAPLPKVWGSRRREPAPRAAWPPAGVPWWQRESTTSDFRTESTRSSDPSRRGWPGTQREKERERRGQGQAKGGARGCLRG